ncbi:unnamed protein product [Schistosoma curassoni]|uniref:Secreted protein n=1 Tax=Schistosoma curassoni TaxID=6186 RepID=A0A183KDC0_9TREM|nr:unnamed protein product [Schistosoma curassoni]
MASLIISTVTSANRKKRQFRPTILLLCVWASQFTDDNRLPIRTPWKSYCWAR